MSDTTNHRRCSPTEIKQIHSKINELMAETVRLSEEASKPSPEPTFYLMMLLHSLFGAANVATGVALPFYSGLTDHASSPRPTHLQIG